MLMFVDVLRTAMMKCYYVVFQHCLMHIYVSLSHLPLYVRSNTTACTTNPCFATPNT